MIPIRLSDLIAVAILLLALAGGVQFYRLPNAIPAFLVFGMLAVAVAAWLVWRGQRNPFLAPSAVFVLAMAISAIANLDIWPTTLSRIILAVAAMAVMILAHAIGPKRIFDGLHRAAMIWPVVFVGVQTRWADNPNIIGFWFALFAVVAISYRSRLSLPLFIVHCSLLIVTGSRGAILALAVGLAVLFRFTHHAPRTTLLTGLAALIGLAIWRPNGTMYRLLFWRDATQSALANPVFGVGSGGLYARELMIKGYPHAHNIFFSIWAELGAIGLLACLLAGCWLYVSRFTFHVSRWQLAILTGILAHCLVDDLLWWPGPLLFFAMVAGGSKKLPPGGQKFGKMRP